MFKIFKKKTDIPEYLAHYGMHRPPFSKTPENDMYYSEPTRKQRLDILLHLAQYTNELLVIIGDKGMGKTMFLQEFINNTGDHWKVCHIVGHSMMTEEQFLQGIYRGFNIAHASNNKVTMLSNLKKRLDNLLQEALPVILVIDDAHLFSSGILSIILEIASIKNVISKTSMRVILFSEPQIKITLAQPELDEKHRLIVRKIDLPPINEAHTGYYLHHRLSQAGMEAEQFLTKSTIIKIFKQSHGNPQKINEVADKLLFETTPIIRRTSNVEAQKKKLAGGKYVLLTMVVAIIAGVYIFQSNFKRETPNTETLVANKANMETTKPLKLPALPDKEPEKLGISPNPPNETKTAKFAEVDDPMQKLKEELADKQPLELKNQTTVSSITQPAKEADLALPQSKRPKDANWILGQDSEYYTLQLVSGHQQSTIENFIKKYRLDPRELSYFYSQRKGQGWHNLTYGVYPDRKTANNAIKQLPSGLAKEKPWIRKMRNIQSEISQSR